MPDSATIFVGFAVGLIVGLTGVGGGSLMTPSEPQAHHLGANEIARASRACNLGLMALFGAVIGALVTLTPAGAGAIGFAVLLLAYAGTKLIVL